ncbi:peptidoglycan-binding domain-containing protein [Pedococcus sp. 5OH_020]|uniref:peptidoglycan-binding domain-containing protein n=1 Tax=Pedococcus sp. 5OH_020 TaxID=2989814 RepID=UPI0022E9BA55|nr:peptidoglycan-binding domain-containing protein [Pedococcus sp. 5OH_020]
MTTSAAVLKAHGIVRTTEVVELAALAGLELAAAATLLQKESGGGANVYGHDAVETGGFYTKGGPVTAANYRKYKAHRSQLGAQGVGPVQLTLPAFQDRADDKGGCFDWAVNALVGFQILAGNITALGVRSGFRAYNGSGPAAERYADDALAKLRVWRDRLAGTPTAAPHVGRPVLHEGDTGALVSTLQKFLNRTFPLYSHVDLAPQRYGPQTSKVIAEFQRRAGVAGPGVVKSGTQVGPPTWAALEFFGFR